jgi:hypothetical protein
MAPAEVWAIYIGTIGTRRLSMQCTRTLSQAAGITIEGYGHGASIVDINLDGWKDIYVTNDFLSSNILLHQQP